MTSHYMHQLSWLFVEVISWVPFLKYILKNSHICLTKVFENCIETEEKTTKVGFWWLFLVVFGNTDVLC